MVALISAIARRPAPSSAPTIPSGLDELHRIEQAAGFSMVAFESGDEAGEQPAVLWESEAAPKSEEPGVTRRVASLIDECTAAVSSYLRPAF